MYTVSVYTQNFLRVYYCTLNDVEQTFNHYKCKKNLQFIHKLTASDTSKTAKITKKVITHQHIA